MKIHPTANVHRTAILLGDIEIGENSVIGPNCYLEGPIRIGSGNKIYPNVIIGTDAEHRSKISDDMILIGNNNVIRELTVIQRGTGERSTEIQDNCFIMNQVYVAHDCLIESDVTVAANAVFAGHSHVMQGANIGLISACHQFSTIGAYAMVGMGSIITKDIPPFSLVTGNPARFKRLNSHRLKLLGISESEITLQDGKMSSTHPLVNDFLERFYAHSRRGKVVALRVG